MTDKTPCPDCVMLQVKVAELEDKLEREGFERQLSENVLHVQAVHAIFAAQIGTLGPTEISRGKLKKVLHNATHLADELAEHMEKRNTKIIAEFRKGEKERQAIAKAEAEKARMQDAGEDQPN